MKITWQLIGSDLEKDLRTCAALKPSNNKEAHQILAAERAVKANTPLKSEWGATAAKVFWLREAGTSAFVIPRWTIRRVTQEGDAAAYIEAMTGLDRVDEQFDSTLFSIPDGPPDWMKKPPIITRLDGGKFDIVQDWWGGRWSHVLYGGSATP